MFNFKQVLRFLYADGVFFNISRKQFGRETFSMFFDHYSAFKFSQYDGFRLLYHPFFFRRKASHKMLKAI